MCNDTGSYSQNNQEAMISSAPFNKKGFVQNL